MSQSLVPTMPLETEFQPTEQQVKALDQLSWFMNQTAIYLFLLAGYAGVGKSRCIFQLVKELLLQGKRIVMTAPTYKAVNVLRRMASEQGITGVDFMTVHSLMGLSLTRRGEEKILQQTGANYAGLFDLVVIDECSMVDQQLWHFIEQIASGTSPQLFAAKRPRIILMGDPAQLNPVNEGRSPAFNVPDKAILTQIVRQGKDNPLLEFVTTCRHSVIKTKVPFKPFVLSSPNKQQGALLIKRSRLLQHACKQITQHFAQDPDRFRVLCWTNHQVDDYNQQIRSHLYGKHSPRFVRNERLIARDPIYAPDRKTILMQTSTEFTIREIHEDRYAGYRAWRLVVELDEGLQKQLYTLHEEDQPRFDLEAEQLLASAKRTPFLWRRYYQHLETFANVRPCFALTVHNSQGSTFREVGIDGADLSKRLTPDRADTPIERKAKVKEHNRLWYVSASRAQQRVLIC